MTPVERLTHLLRLPRFAVLPSVIAGVLNLGMGDTFDPASKSVLKLSARDAFAMSTHESPVEVQPKDSIVPSSELVPVDSSTRMPHPAPPVRTMFGPVVPRSS